jgi:hypothetical protein
LVQTMLVTPRLTDSCLDSQFHVPGRRFSQRRWDGVNLHLGPQGFRGREL